MVHRLIEVTSSKDFERENALRWHANSLFWLEHHTADPRLVSSLREVLKQTLSRQPEGRRATVVDMGCGAGWMVEVLPRRSSVSYVGVDANPAFVEYARSKYEGAKRVSFEAGALATYRRRDRAFLCMLVYSLNEMPELRTAFASGRRIVRVGGYLLTVTLDPLAQIVRTFRGGKALTHALTAYRSRKSIVAIEKSIEIAGEVSKIPYFIVLHSMAEMSTIAKESGFVVHQIIEPLASDAKPFDPNPAIVLYKRVR